MPKYRIEVTSTKTEIYELEAANKDEALYLYGLGNYKGLRDENNDILEITEVAP